MTNKKDYLKSIQEFVKEKEKPSWTDYFMSIALVASTRSEDAQTQHGCVITDEKNRIIGVGYNSFPRKMPDSKLPNMRPKKYKWMVHAERNALSNCTSSPDGGTAYITGPPCLDCAKSLYQEGIKRFVCYDGHGTFLQEEEDQTITSLIAEYGGIEIDFVKPDYKKVFDEIYKKI